MPNATQSSPDALPASMHAILHALDELEADAKAVVRDLTDEQVNWQPNEGKAWSIAQCLDHIGKTNVVYVNAMRSSLPADGQVLTQDLPIRPGWFGRFFLWSVEPPSRFKVPAPAKIQPASQMARDEALRVFVESQRLIRSLLPECARSDVNRIRFQNPFLAGIKFTVGTGLLVMAAHGRRHVWQARRVRESMLQVR